MKALFDERWPGGDFVRIDGRGEWNGLLSGAGMVVLLYPDAIGLGFGEVENQVEKLKAEGTPVMVLNGRHREFVLDRPRRRRLRLRRFLERTMAGEFAALVPFVVATPLLLLDRVRGRR
jgi:hypothetical protein